MIRWWYWAGTEQAPALLPGMKNQKGTEKMNQKEKTLFIELCRFRNPDRRRLERLLRGGSATPAVLGMLFANRMAGVACRTLTDTGLLSLVDREFRNAISGAATLNRRRNQDYFGSLRYLSGELDACGVPYALLKGAYLCGWYPEGCRTSNDADVLVAPEDVGKISARLRLAGFRQGYLRDGKFVPASRGEIIESKMTRGETVPFIRETRLAYLPYLEVDLNFSLDYRNSDADALRGMLAVGERRRFGNTTVRTLNPQDFILHLCAHLYKEATTLPWVRMKRDMTFYKYADLYALLADLPKEERAALAERAAQLGIRTEMIYCLLSVDAFYGTGYAADLHPTEAEIMALCGVVAPAEKKQYRYSEPDPVVRFFAPDRMKLLQEAET